MNKDNQAESEEGDEEEASDNGVVEEEITAEEGINEEDNDNKTDKDQEGENEEDEEKSEDGKIFSDNYEEIRISKTKEENTYSNGPSSYIAKVPQANSNEASSQSKQQIRNSRVIPFVCDNSEQLNLDQSLSEKRSERMDVNQMRTVDVDGDYGYQPNIQVKQAISRTMDNTTPAEDSNS